MGRFRLKEKEQKKEWVVELEESFNDVDIVVNGYTIAYFESESGFLKLIADADECNLPCDNDGYIKVEWVK